MAALQSGDVHTMEHAAISIGIRGEAQDVQPLVNALKHADEDHHLRTEIYRALGLIGDSSGNASLLAAFTAEPRPEVRAVVASSLGAIGSHDSIQTLLDALIVEDKIVKSRIIDALGAYDHPDTLSQLSALSKDSKNASTSRRALRALGATGSEHATKPLLDALGLASDDDATQAVIIDALSQIAPLQAAEPLTQLLKKTNSPVLQAKLAVALGAIGGEGSVETLVGLLESNSQSTKQVAVRMLADAQSANATPGLLRLYDTMAQRRPASLKALPNDVAAALVDFDLMKSTVRAILESDPERGVKAFRDASEQREFDRGTAAGLKLANRAYALRRLAIHAIGYTNDTSQTPWLTRIVEDEPDARLRAVAMRSLGVLGADNAESIGLAALSDNDASVRSTAASVLGRVGSDKSVAALIEVLGDAHPQVRSQSALGLGLLRDERAVTQLKSVVDSDENETVIESAKQALIMLAAELP